MQPPAERFDTQTRQRIQQAVAAAESRTSAEIVAVVAPDSGRYERAEDLVGFGLGLIAMAVTGALWPGELPEHGSWAEISPWLHLAAQIAAAVVGFVIGIAVANRIGWLRRLLTPGRQMRDKVWTRARKTFFDRRIYGTSNASGLLVYVSLLERTAAIIADRTVLEKLGQPSLDELCSHLTAQIRQQDLATALCSTIEAAGVRLATILPRTGEKRNELDDSLVTLEKDPEPSPPREGT
jgi:putative membrane protein